MDEIVNKVAERTGVAADTVRQVLQSAAGFIKEKLPPQFAGYVDGMLGGQGGAAGGGAGGGMGDLASKLGGMFGGKA